MILGEERTAELFPDLLRFLLDPQEEAFRSSSPITEHARSELLAIDAYLSDEVGSAWDDAKLNHGLVIDGSDWATLWAGRMAGRLVLSERERGNTSWQNVLSTYKPLERRRLSDGAGPVDIVTSGSFIDIELQRTYHPSIDGAVLRCDESYAEKFEALSGRYESAIGLLRRHYPEGFSLFSKSVCSIVPLKVTPELPAGMCVSLSVAASPGVALLTMTPLILLSETLLHEAAHSRLSAAEDVVPIWASNNVRVQSPLRPDPRPIGGLFHQAYVLFWLCQYFRCFQNVQNEPVLTKNIRQIEKRISELETGFRDVIDTLSDNRRYLTDFGRNVLEAMAERGSKC